MRNNIYDIVQVKRIVLLLAVVLPLTVAMAQTTDSKFHQAMDEVKVQLVEFDTERMLDSLDQEKLPRPVSGGLIAGANMSNFIIMRNHIPMSSFMRVGGELGGFLDFSITKHFAIQPQVILTAHQNYFAATDTTNRLWSFGVDIPIYFLGRFGNLSKGYVQFGGGLFTHFTFASNVRDKYQSWDSPTSTKTDESKYKDYRELYRLHDNHFGICLMVGYEFKFGMQINAQYKVSLSDITTFYGNNKGQEVADALIFPQSVSLHLGYRWR